MVFKSIAFAIALLFTVPAFAAVKRCEYNKTTLLQSGQKQGWSMTRLTKEQIARAVKAYNTIGAKDDNDVMVASDVDAVTLAEHDGAAFVQFLFSKGKCMVGWALVVSGPLAEQIMNGPGESKS